MRLREKGNLRLVREEINQQLPSILPVMVVPGVTLFPNALLPLFIFEPHYRVMLEDVLSAGRMLAMARDESTAPDSVAGAGLVRACIRNPDGSSNLVLQGISRVRLKGWEQEEPYRLARIESLQSVARHADVEESEAMQDQLTQLHALCARFKEQGIELPDQFESYLGQITSVGVITDLVASTLLSDPAVRQELLSELEISKRLARLLEGLRAQLN
jgi:Lon protease-like protein